MKQQLLIINAIDEVLELKSKDSFKTDEEIIRAMVNINPLLKKDLVIFACLGKALKLKNENSSLTRREIINTILKNS